MAVTMTLYVTWGKSGHCKLQDDVTHKKSKMYFPLQANKVSFLILIAVPCILIKSKFLFTNKCTFY